MAEKVFWVMALVFLEIDHRKVASNATGEAAPVRFGAVNTGPALSDRGCIGINCPRWGGGGRSGFR